MKYSQWLTLVVLVVCLYIFWQIRMILLLTFAAVVFAVVLNRAVMFIQQWIPSRRAAVLTVVLSGILTVGIFGIIVVPPFSQQFQELIVLSPEIVDRLQQWLQDRSLADAGIWYEVQIADVLSEQLRNLNLEMLIDRFFLVFSNTLSLTLNTLLVIVIALMMLFSPKPYRRLFRTIFPSSIRQAVDRVLDKSEEAIAGWFIGTIFNIVVIALMSTIGLWILGVPLALANGLLAGLLAFIPNIGPILSVVPPAVIALLEVPWKAIAVIGLYVVIQQIESNFLTPFVMKRQVNLLPAVTLLAQVVFSIFFGFLGPLLALPLALTTRQWLEEFWVKRYAEVH